MTTPPNFTCPERDPFGRLLRIAARNLGALFLLFGLGLLIREIRFGQSAHAVAGTIMEVRVRQNADGPTYHPVVEFRTLDGRVAQFEGLSVSPAPEVGTPVSVLYNRSKPEQARINSFVQRWLFPTVFIPIGFSMVVGASIWSSVHARSQTMSGREAQESSVPRRVAPVGSKVRP
jgi:hypothetical protein